MIKKPLILSLLSVLLFGCSVKQNTEHFFAGEHITRTEVPLSGHITGSEQQLPTVERLSVIGPFNVNIQVISNPYVSNPNTINVAMSGDSALIEHAQDFVQDGTLKVFMDNTYTYDPNAKIQLTLVVYHSALKQVYYDGQGQVDIQPLNAQHFSLIMHSGGSAFMAGHADRLDLLAKGNASINAKCVYADAVFVNTVDSAQAEVLGGEGVSGLAANTSNIYYYGRPDLAAPYQRQSGSMMAMEGILPSQMPPAENQIPVPSQPEDFGIK